MIFIVPRELVYFQSMILKEDGGIQIQIRSPIGDKFSFC